jgi:hypothetical protein
MRNELPAPYEADSKETHAWVSWDELRAGVGDYEIREDDAPLPFLLLHSEDYHNQETAPEDLARWVAGLPGWSAPPSAVAADQILDAELLAGEAGAS